MVTTSAFQFSNLESSEMRLQELHELQNSIAQNEGFAHAMRATGSTEDAAKLAAEYGVHVTPESLWRNRGKHGLPAWRA
jgi:hypothetical protein